MKYLLLFFLLFLPLVGDESKSPFVDEEDGKLDVSDWLASKYGFLPVPMIITGPTFGLGAGLNLMFLHDKFAGKKSADDRYIPPSISGVAAAATENGSQFGAAYHLGFWREDTIRTTTFIGRPNANLDFYPSILGKEYEVTMNLEGWAFYQEVKFRIQNSNFLIGANYLYMNISSKPKDFPVALPPELQTITDKSAALALAFEYDSRDSIFTPSEGIYAKAVVASYNEAFGGNYNFLNYRLKAFEFIPLTPKVNLGLRLEAQHVDGSAPYYFYPSVDIRGIASARYQGQSTAVGEAELKWEFIDRWSVLGFLGTGKAFGKDKINEKTSFSDAKFRTSGGVGFRYTIARKFGLQAGVDVAHGPEESAVYITAGSAWNAFF
jgi:surface antigen Omp85-like protein